MTFEERLDALAASQQTMQDNFNQWQVRWNNATATLLENQAHMDAAIEKLTKAQIRTEKGLNSFRRLASGAYVDLNQRIMNIEEKLMDDDEEDEDA